MDAARNGNAEAQRDIGYDYLNGLSGLTKDYGAALAWFQKSARQGDPDGQRYLGLMYNLGNAVPKNRVIAYAWYNLAAAENPNWAGDRDPLEKEMTPEEVRRGQALSSAWKLGQLISDDAQGK